MLSLGLTLISLSFLRHLYRAHMRVFHTLINVGVAEQQRARLI